MGTWGWFNKKMTSYLYRKSHCGDKTIIRPSYLHNGISYTSKMTSLYWIRPLVIIMPAHGLAPNSTRSSAGTVRTAKSDAFSSKFQLLSMTLYNFLLIGWCHSKCLTRPYEIMMTSSKGKHFLCYWLSVGNSPVTGEFPSQTPVMRCFDVFFDLRLNKRLSKQSQGWRFEMPSHSSWCHCNGSAWKRLISYWMRFANSLKWLNMIKYSMKKLLTK